MELFSELSDKFEKLKTELLTSSCEKISEMILSNISGSSSTSNPNYGETLNDSQKIILSNQKNPQSNNQTRSDVIKYVSPVNLNKIDSWNGWWYFSWIPGQTEDDIFLNGAEYKIVCIWSTKKKPDIFQVQLQVDNMPYKKIMNPKLKIEIRMRLISILTIQYDIIATV